MLNYCISKIYQNIFAHLYLQCFLCSSILSTSFFFSVPLCPPLLNFRLGVGHLITTTCKDVCGKYSNDAGGFSGVADQVADAGKFQ